MLNAATVQSTIVKGGRRFELLPFDDFFFAFSSINTAPLYFLCHLPGYAAWQGLCNLCLSRPTVNALNYPVNLPELILLFAKMFGRFEYARIGGILLARHRRSATDEAVQRLLANVDF